MSDEDRAYLKEIIDSEYEHILDLGTAIEAAQSDTLEEFRGSFRSRIDLWVSRYTDTVNQARIYFGNRTRLEWIEGDTKDKCESCLALNGIVAFAFEWEQSGVRPQSPPNGALTCGGWECQCRLEVTDKRRTPNALQRIMDIAVASNVGKSYNPYQPRVPAGDPEGGQWTSEDSMTIQHAKDIVSKLANRFGMPEVNVINDTTIGTFANASVLGGGIAIDEELINEVLDLENSDTVAKNKEEIIVHEYGHIIQERLMNDEKYFGYGFSRPSMYYERGIGEQARESLGQRLFSIAKNKGGLISEYATTNDQEYFCESFVLYVRGKKWHDKINPELLDVFKRIDNVE